VEDDGLGEELQVVWEVEPGATVHKGATLPDPTAGFDDPLRLDAFLDAVCWGELVKRADKDVADLTGVLQELRATIEHKL